MIMEVLRTPAKTVDKKSFAVLFEELNSKLYFIFQNYQSRMANKELVVTTTGRIKTEMGTIKTATTRNSEGIGRRVTAAAADGTTTTIISSFLTSFLSHNYSPQQPKKLHTYHRGIAEGTLVQLRRCRLLGGS